MTAMPALRHHPAIEIASPPPDDPEAAARAAQLRYVSDDRPGITRRRIGEKRFSYRDPSGAAIRDSAKLQRIKSLAIPPAWIDVWICPSPNGHIQATGRDARGRKQYRYHVRWRAKRDETKYEHMLEFGHALPRIRERVEADLALPGLPREKVLAAVVSLLERTLARIGNQEYAETNKSFGLTTLRNRHVQVTGGRIELDFRAKHGIRHSSVVNDRKLARIIKNIRDLPGSELFQYLDEDGERRQISSEDVNDYLREISGSNITAKDFRTFAATSLALVEFAALEEGEPTKSRLLDVVKRVAAKLGNTPAVCRKCYIHPRVLSSYLDGSLGGLITYSGSTAGPKEIQAVEAMVMRLIEQWSKGEAPSLVSA